MKKYAKLLLVVTCLAMVFAMSVGVSATEYNTEYDVIYDIGTGTTAPINVLVTIESADLDYTVIPVSLGTSTTTHKVVDALLGSDVSNAGYSFYAYNYTTSQYVPLTASDNYFSHIKKGSTYYGGTGQGYSGWQFRVNGGIPQDPSSGWGADITTTPIADGDVIALYIDDSYSENASTRFTRATVNSATANAVNVSVTESHQWYGANYFWNHPNFATIGGLTVGVYSDSSFSSSAFKGSATADSTTGIANISGLSLGAGTYFVKVTGNMSGSPAISSCVTTFTIGEDE